MSTDAEQYDQPLRDALAALEAALETPLVPGDLVAWVTPIQQGFAPVGVYLRRQIERVHTHQFDRIKHEDLGLASRVEQLAEEDRELLQILADLSQLSERLSAVSTAVEPDEAAIEPELQRLVDEGLAFVIRVRKQESAIATWLVESLDRDRGDVD